MRYLLLIIGCSLAGCASDRDVVMQDPRSGETTTCQHSAPLGLDPWSQTYACVAQHAAQGWIPLGK